MPAGGGTPISENNLIYSIQRTYIINMVLISDTFALTCNQRIDVPVIEPVADFKAVIYDMPITIVPCVELILQGRSLEGVNLVFETNEGVTVLPIKIGSGEQEPLKNPYSYERWVLVLPRGTTGIKSCKVLFGDNGDTIQHNFTFGIMPPPYNYDNALFGFISAGVVNNSSNITELDRKLGNLTARVDALENKAGT